MSPPIKIPYDGFQEPVDKLCHMIEFRLKVSVVGEISLEGLDGYAKSS